MSKSRKKRSRKRKNRQRVAAKEPIAQQAGAGSAETSKSAPEIQPSARVEPSPEPAPGKAPEPARPAESAARPAPSAPADDTGAAAGSSRRRFFWQIWLALGGVALLEYLWMVLDFLNPRSLAEEVGTVIAGPVERFAINTVTAFQRGEFYLSRLEDGGLLALSRTCTHLGCTVPWDDTEGRFICPCHSSEYDARGVVISPPAPRPLDLYPIRIENGVVKVDIIEPIKRTAFDETQVTPV